MIQIQQLTRRFGEATAVDRLDLEIRSGEIFGFLGPNGAGKTTTIRMMIGLLRPTSGTVVYSNGSVSHDVLRDNLAVRRRVGYIPDSPYLYEKLTGREHLRFIGELHSVPEAQLEEEIAGFLRLFHLESVADQPIEGYSHGMRQKIVMSGSLLHHPDYLIVDEPMVGLDPRSARITKDLFIQLARERNTTVFISTHSLDLAEEVCDRIGIISRGRLLALGTYAEMQAKVEKSDSRLEEIFLTLTEEEPVSPE